VQPIEAVVFAGDYEERGRRHFRIAGLSEIFRMFRRVGSSHGPIRPNSL